MYVCTFTSAGKDSVKFDTFPRTLARQAVTGSVAYAKMSLQGERCVLIYVHKQHTTSHIIHSTPVAAALCKVLPVLLDMYYMYQACAQSWLT